MSEEHASLNQLWDYLKGHDGEISEIKTSVAGLQVSVQATNAKIDMIVNSIARMENVISRPGEKPNYVGMATVLIGTSALVGSLFITSISPIRDSVESLHTWKELHQAELIKEAYDNGVRDRAIKDLQNRRCGR